MSALIEYLFQRFSPFFPRLFSRFLCSPQKAARMYLSCLDKHILNRYRKNRCVYESRLYKEDFLCGVRNTTVESILKSDGRSVPKNQILCISAEPGYGKDFLAKRICVLDYDYTYANEQIASKSFNPFSTQGCGRIPFIIQRSDIERYFDREKADRNVGSNPLCWICTASMMRVLNRWGSVEGWKCSNEDELFELILECLQEPLEKGNLFVLFEKDAMSTHSKELETILDADLSAKVAQEAPKNLLVFVLDSADQNPLRWAPYRVALTQLTEEEVLDYVRFCSGGSDNIVQEFKALFTAIPSCTIPDCLLFMTETHIGQGSSKAEREDIPKVETAADLYRDCIRRSIQARFPLENVDEVFRQLQRYAWSTYCDQPHFSLPDEVAGSLMYVSGKRNHLLKKTKEFRFEGCREYLFAEKLYEKLLGDPEEGRDKELLQQANNNVKARLLEIAIRQYKEDQRKEGKNRNTQTGGVLRRLWMAILDQGTVMSYPEMEFLTRFMERLDSLGQSIDMDEYGDEYLVQAIRQMEERVYDNRLFQLFSNANKKLKNYRINRQLKKQYLSNVKSQTRKQDEIEAQKKDRFNRRYLFYAGMHTQVDSKIIEGVYSENLSIHMKCHLMRAMRDNYFAEMGRDPIRDHMERMLSYGEKSDNQILRLNILILQLLLMEVPLDPSCFQKSLLLKQLDDKEYWVRAHSADVIAYITDDASIPEKLAEAITKEMGRGEDGYIRLKVANHMAEAICEFYFFRVRQKLPCSNNVKDYQERAIKRMLWLIQPENLESTAERLTAMSMYATIAESIKYLLLGDYSSRPTFIGVHVSDGREQWDQNADLVTEALKMTSEHYGDREIEIILHNFQDALDNIVKEELSAAQNKWSLPTPEEPEVVRVAKEETDSSNDRKEGNQVINIYGPVGGVTESGPVIVDQDNFGQSAASVTQLIGQLEKVLGKECSKDQLEAVRPILQELRDMADGTAPAPSGKKSWTDRILGALSLGADVLTISQAPWWSQVKDLLQGIVGMLPK